jgi:L-seryl-tRNA(Ser) seleniumtransferase
MLCPMDKAHSLAWPALAPRIPSLDRLLRQPSLEPLLRAHGRTKVTGVLRTQLAGLRQSARAGTLTAAALAEDALVASLAAALGDATRPRLQAVFNLTGTVLHTNLGRALLPAEAVEAVTRAMTSPVNLEYDLAGGRRGERDALIERQLCKLTGAQAATVVNNNAAAVLLILSALAARREVVVSRGELIEIGGSFRLPDIMRQAGARLVEVGTTNRTHLKDYAQALGPRSALLLKVHTSNYVVRGFTSSVSLAELARLGRSHGVPVIADLGSGSLLDLARWGLPSEPTARAAADAGADLVCFSADKLLGGPQAGLIAGRAELVARLRRHPLKRALRVGKLTLAALEPVLALYSAPEFLASRLPTLRQLTRPEAAMREQAMRLQPPVQQSLGDAYRVACAPLLSQIGSGALPLEQLPSHGLAIRALRRAGRDHPRGSLKDLERRLRALPRPVLGRIAEDTLWLDLRCLDPAAEAAFLAQWSELGP